MVSSMCPSLFLASLSSLSFAADAISFTASTERDPSTGWTVVRLAYRDAARPDRSIEAAIIPEAGSNCFSLKSGGTELLRQPPKLADLPGFGYGNPVLYPTPNRIRKGTFTWKGETFRFNDPGKEGNFIHGLVGRERWALAGQPKATVECAEARTVLAVEPGGAVHRKFPFRHEVSLTFRLERDGLRIAFKVENREESRELPFGFAFHPYFNYLGPREEMLFSVPAEMHMEATPDLLPTGRLEPLDGTRFDLRKPAVPALVGLDDVYWGLQQGKPAWFASKSAGIKVLLEGSAEFTHMVVYTPKGAPFFCMENQTCSTDAHNLHAKGLEKEAHLLVVRPGGSAGGSVTYRIVRE
jgi:aldose 1-epimerase